MSTNVKISPAKGRPMLHWVGKSAPKEVSYFPAQLSETFRAKSPPAEPVWEVLKDNWANLLLHGDNKEVLSSLLVNGFRGKIDLIYIDPPFASGANYVRKVALRGHKDKILEGEGLTVLEEKQYEDIWANDTYLQYMYERLILMRELLSDQGSIYLHCDWRKSHHLRFLMDEVFGADNFLNEIVWFYPNSGLKAKSRKFHQIHDVLFRFSKQSRGIWNEQREPFEDGQIKKQPLRKFNSITKKADVVYDENGKIEYIEKTDKLVDSVWRIPMLNIGHELLGYPTQKPEALLERIIKASSHSDSIVLDCFCGSGTAAAVAERLGRRWIMADMNRGAIQTTSKRLQSLLQKDPQHNMHQSGAKVYGFATYRVNNYDFRDQNALKEIIISKYGIEPTRSDRFFNGMRNGALVKIIELNRPLSVQDLQAVDEELKNRPDEARHVTLIGNGIESSACTERDRRKRVSPINSIELIDAQKHQLVVFSPAQAEISFEKQGDKMHIRIIDYISPTVLQRLAIDRTLFNEQIGDFRAQIDCISIDSDYNGEVFRVTQDDIPSSKGDFIKGSYEIALPQSNAQVAIKIVDVLGEEVLKSSSSHDGS